MNSSRARSLLPSACRDGAVADQKASDELASRLKAQTDFPQVWNDRNLPDRERKRIARLLLEDVTLRKEDRVIVQVRFKGGALRTLDLPLPQPFCVLFRTRPGAAQLDRRPNGLDRCAQTVFRQGQTRNF